MWNYLSVQIKLSVNWVYFQIEKIMITIWGFYWFPVIAIKGMFMGYHSGNCLNGLSGDECEVEGVLQEYAGLCDEIAVESCC